MRIYFMLQKLISEYDWSSTVRALSIGIGRNSMKANKSEVNRYYIANEITRQRRRSPTRRFTRKFVRNQLYSPNIRPPTYYTSIDEIKARK